MVRRATPPFAQRNTLLKNSMGVSGISSSGLGRHRGGNSRAAGEVGPVHTWTLGEGAGENFESFQNPRAFEDYELRPRCTVDPQNLTIARAIPLLLIQAGETSEIKRFGWPAMSTSRPEGG